MGRRIREKAGATGTGLLRRSIRVGTSYGSSSAPVKSATLKKAMKGISNGLPHVDFRFPVLCLHRCDEQENIISRGLPNLGNRVPVVCLRRCDEQKKKTSLGKAERTNAEGKISPMLNPRTSPQVFEVAPSCSSPSAIIPTAQIEGVTIPPGPVVAAPLVSASGSVSNNAMEVICVSDEDEDAGPVPQTGLEEISPPNSPIKEADTPLQDQDQDQLDQQMHYPICESSSSSPIPSCQMVPVPTDQQVESNGIEFIDISDDDDASPSQNGHEDISHPNSPQPQPSYSGAPPQHHQGQQGQEMPYETYEHMYQESYFPIPPHDPQSNPSNQGSPQDRNTQFYLNCMDKIYVDHDNDQTILTVPVTLVLKRPVQVVSQKSEQLTQQELMDSLQANLSYLQDNQVQRDYAIYVGREKSSFRCSDPTPPTPTDEVDDEGGEKFTNS